MAQQHRRQPSSYFELEYIGLTKLLVMLMGLAHTSTDQGQTSTPQ
jgi:hypothetical protein